MVCAQNGVANERAALRRFARVYGMCVWLPATFLTPGTVIAEGYPYPGLLHLGRYPTGTDATAEQIAADLAGSGLLAPLRPDVMRWKYGKLLANVGNGLAALFGARHHEWYEQVRVESGAVLAAAGIAHTTRAEEAAARGDSVQLRPIAVEGDGAASGAAAYRLGSTWQSLARRAGSTEVDYLNGEIVLLGRITGVPVPVNAAVQWAVHRALHTGIGPGEFPPAEFEALLG